MKINPPTSTAPIAALERSSAARPRPVERSTPADGVSLSQGADWVQRLREEASDVPEIRADVVAAVRAELASGGLQVDLDTVVDGLLADL